MKANRSTFTNHKREVIKQKMYIYYFLQSDGHPVKTGSQNLCGYFYKKGYYNGIYFMLYAVPVIRYQVWYTLDFSITHELFSYDLYLFVFREL